VTTSGGNVLWFAPELSFWAALPFAGIGAALFALLIGLPTLRLRGPYFSIAMLGVFVAMREIIRVAKPLTGGGSGLTLPPQNALFGFPQNWFRMGEYLVMVGLMGIAVALAWWIRRSEFGQSLIAIREDEVGAEMRGINTTFHKITIFMVVTCPWLHHDSARPLPPRRDFGDIERPQRHNFGQSIWWPKKQRAYQ